MSIFLIIFILLLILLAYYGIKNRNRENNNKLNKFEVKKKHSLCSVEDALQEDGEHINDFINSQL